MSSLQGPALHHLPAEHYVHMAPHSEWIPAWSPSAKPSPPNSHPRSAYENASFCKGKSRLREPPTPRLPHSLSPAAMPGPRPLTAVGSIVGSGIPYLSSSPALLSCRQGRDRERRNDSRMELETILGGIPKCEAGGGKAG